MHFSLYPLNPHATPSVWTEYAKGGVISMRKLYKLVKREDERYICKQKNLLYQSFCAHCEIILCAIIQNSIALLLLPNINTYLKSLKRIVTFKGDAVIK